ncbi:hypothetical protein H3009_gp30 [Bacillus phage Harambe]|uniref:Uncharacterized protein n=2 Tax=Harambevirus TaxID=2842721 RepID=A0A1W6JSC7_9CAUD|nr:hypothetical protein H3009_gp30 [Bacillus phage Harambe]YP_009910206.1 hypothetical protein H3010_gp27 [Bacillus phage BeachBum]ARM70179.1 hypothetical protein HARAMBE_30 [Bacillus phage Harambe]ARQ95208.1 hypothetical protein BEACHBUM_27 [Bacillus phage BeachBum]
MKTQTLVESLILINKHRKDGTLTTDEAFKLANLLTNAYEEERNNEQVQKIS